VACRSHKDASHVDILNRMVTSPEISRQYPGHSE
jgi:hypothetical protein